MAKSASRIPGVLFADVNFATGVMLLEYDTDTDPRGQVMATVIGAGHAVQPLGEDAARAPEPSWWMRHRAEVGVAVSGLMIAVGWATGATGAVVLSHVAYGLAIIAGGMIMWRRAVTSLLARTLDMNVLMTIAVSGAAAIGEWGEGATVIFLFALGGVLEARSVARTRRSIRDLMALAPERAHVKRDGVEVETSPAEVLVGETIIVRPGERVPLDGVIVAGASAFDESPITGESVPADRAEGDRVFAGALNTTGLVEVRVAAAAADTTLARIVHLVEAAQASRAPVQRFVDRFSSWYTPAVIAIAAALAIGVPVAGEITGSWPGLESWSVWMYRALVLLVISCPCALVVSTPVAIVSAITRATRDGVLVKGGAFLERAGQVRAVVFDKTGTLTEGRPAVAEVLALADEDARRVLALAAALEAHSNHPLARAVAAAGAEQAAEVTVDDLAEVPGRGVRGRVDGVSLVVGSLTYITERLGSPSVPAAVSAEATRMESDGLTVLALASEGENAGLLGLIGLADEVRAEARAATAALAGGGIEHMVMLTGDNESAAARVASASGVTEFRARLLPEDKTRAVEHLRAEYGVVAMVGDGINDAPALAAADIGIAMGAAGSDTAIETADVALMRDDLTALAGFFALGRATMRTITQNITLSIVTKAVVLALAVTGHATLWMAVFADTGVALVVIANGLRLLRSR